LEAVIIDEKQKKDWESFIQEHPMTVAWQSYEWNSILSQHYRMDFYPIALFDGKKVQGILPLYKMKTVFGHERLISVPYAVAGGITADAEEVRQGLFEKAVKIAKKFNSCPIVLKQYKVKIAGDLRNDRNYHNRELKLSDDIKKIWSNLSNINKEKIEYSKKHSLTLEHPSENLSFFYKTLLQHHRHEGLPCVSEKWIQSLIESGMYSIALLRQGTAVVAGTMVKEFKKSVSFPFTCIPDRNGMGDIFVYNLYWELIKKYAQKGWQVCHSGRIPNNERTNGYRLGWGGVKYNYYYQYYPKEIDRSEFSERRGWKRGVAKRCLRLLPLTLSKSVGPRIIKYFP
jgi:hypothetical protein